MKKRNDIEKMIVKNMYNCVSEMKPLNAALARNPTGL